MRTIRITGTGSALPGRIVTNKELEQMVETSDEWIRERTGIAERHVSVGETVVTLASEAARKALEQAGKRAEEIDLILVATCSSDFQFISFLYTFPECGQYSCSHCFIQFFRNTV